MMSAGVRALLAVFLVLYGLSSFGRAQVTVVKNGAAVHEDKVNLLFSAACRVVAEEFHLAGSSRNLFPVTLVLNDPDERVIGDELHQLYFIYMNRWDETQFATSASRLAIQHVVSRERKTKMVAEILRRANRAAPVTVDQLQGLKRDRKAFR